MKKYLAFCLLLFLIVPLFAQQQLAVKSFKKLPNDLDARVNEIKKDQNGDLCALIKVVTTQTGFSFDCGSIGIVKTVQKTSEIWVYIPYGAKRLTISHPFLGILRDYQMPLNIEKATVYELVLISGNVVTTVEETIVSQWLVINTEPAEAMIYINEKFVKSGIYQSKFKPGSYFYRVESPKYHTEAGKFEMTDVKKEMRIVLKPAFGFASITSEPEIGAKVIIDGEYLSQTTPCENIQLSSGDHSIQVIKDNYLPSKQTVTISDGKTSMVKFTLNPNFSELNIQTIQNAEIFVDNESKGKGNWVGRLSIGLHTLEARLDKYKSAKKDIDVEVGKNQNIELIPTPNYGYADIVSIPSGAIIGLDGINYGTTPITIKDLSIGEHELRIISRGYTNIDTTILIIEGKITEVIKTMHKNANQVSLSLPGAKQSLENMPGNAMKGDNSNDNKAIMEGKRVSEKSSINTDYSKVIIKTIENAEIFINNEFKGKNKWQGRLAIGSYTLEARLDKYRTAKSIIEVEFGINQSIDLVPQPLYGSADIVSLPAGAIIGIDGINFGVTPKRINNLFVGEHILRLVTKGYTNVDTTINISYGMITSTKVEFGTNKNGVLNAVSFQQNKDLAIQHLKNDPGMTDSEKSATVLASEIVVTDVEGNTYPTVTIGEQIWMASNLKTNKYNDGSSIPLITDNAAWSKLSTPGYCWYNNDIGSKEHLKGVLYNWYTINTGKLCPIDWHVPTDTEWNSLITYLGGESVAGSKLRGFKTNGLVNNNANTFKNNGFGAFSNGYRNSTVGEFNLGKDYCFWWSSTEFSSANSWYLNLYYSSGLISRLKGPKQCGFSVRCLRD